MDDAVVSCPARRKVAIWDIISSSVMRDLGSSEAFALTAADLGRAFSMRGDGSGKRRTEDTHDVLLLLSAAGEDGLGLLVDQCLREVVDHLECFAETSVVFRRYVLNKLEDRHGNPGPNRAE